MDDASKTSHNQARFRGDMRPLLRLIRPYRGRWVIATTALLAGGGLNLALPQAVRIAIDDAVVAQDAGALNELLIWVLAAVGLLALFVFVRHYLMSWIGNRVVAELRDRTFRHLMNQPPGFFHEEKSGELVSRLTSDIGMLQFAVGSELSIALRSGMTSLGGIGILVWMNPFLSMIMLLIIPVLAIGAVQVRKVLLRRSRKVQDLIAEANAGLKEAIVGIETVQIFQAENRESARYRDRVMGAFQNILKIAIARGAFISGTQSAGYLALGLILYLGAQQVLEGDITYGELSAFVLYTVMVTGGLMSLAGVWTNLQRAVAASGRIFELLETTPTIRTPEAPTALESVQGILRFENVSFTYPARPEVPVLTDISLEISAGETVALVGESGAGKSTISALSQRFYDPDKGAVSLDGHDLRSLSLKTIRNAMATVEQEPVLFSGTIAENIRYGCPEADEKDIQKAAQQACIADFIEGLPNGYQSNVGERGVKLSGGQRQRIAIARALLADPKILILDEATSHLDTANEELVQQALNELMVGRTTLVIAHRLSTIRDAHRILVMQDGHIVEAGSHQELLNKNGAYTHLISAQNTH